MAVRRVTSSWSAPHVRRLLTRTCFAADPRRVEELASLSCEEAVERLLEEARTAPPPERPDWVRTPWQNTERRYADTTDEEFGRMHGATNGRYARETAALRRWWLTEMLTSRVPLRENLTLFWHGHFASSIGKVLVSQAMYEQNATQRKFSLGNFREFLKAMTLDPAMLIYLDLEDSDRAQPNENYARELFELFSLGHGNYTQTDVMEASRALCGWRLDAPPGTLLSSRATDPTTNRRFTRDGLTPVLVAERRDSERKTVLGRSGDLGVDDVIDAVVQHPACGRYLATKLADYFGLYDPERRVVTEMAEAFAAENAELAPMLRVLFTSPEFYADESSGALIKSPIALLIGACRQLDLAARITPGVNRYTAALGQELFNPPNVKGWPGGESWIGAGTLALRYHLADVVLDSHEPPGLDPIGRGRGRPIPLPRDPQERARFLQRMEGAGAERRRGEETSEPAFDLVLAPERLFPNGVPNAPEQTVDPLLERLLARRPRPELREAAVATAARHTGHDRVRAVVRFVLSSPDYQVA